MSQEKQQEPQGWPARWVNKMMTCQEDRFLQLWKVDIDCTLQELNHWLALCEITQVKICTQTPTKALLKYQDKYSAWWDCWAHVQSLTKHSTGHVSFNRNKNTAFQLSLLAHFGYSLLPGSVTSSMRLGKTKSNAKMMAPKMEVRDKTSITLFEAKTSGFCVGSKTF